ncbi:hypothetical protein DMA11_19455 [Marinilabiliaceae bacterium JC017]|nr:hypothetical protein DMA11_19455 [Marinilabiliaceae bacterium JC017]
MHKVGRTLIAGVLLVLSIWFSGQVASAERLVSTETMHETDDTLKKKISELNGISAIGYIPFWRIGLSADGLDLGMPQISVNKFAYQEIQTTPNGWLIKSTSEDVTLSLEIIKEHGICPLSRQVYPYQAVLTLKVAGQAEKTYKGMANRKNQSPLPPHPADAKQSYTQVPVKKERLYKFLDLVKFTLMNQENRECVSFFHYPLRVNAPAAPSVIVDNKTTLLERFTAIFDAVTVKKILNAKYSQVYEREGTLGFAGGMLILTMHNGRLFISAINKD